MVYIIWFITFVIFIISYRKDKKQTLKAFGNSIRALQNLSSAVLGMVTFVGLILAIFPQENLAIIFNYKGVLGFAIVSLLGAIVTIPGPIAFPIAGALLKMGVSKAILASFITTLTMVGIVSSPLEISYFGKRFTFMRQVLSFIAAIFIGLIMGAIL
jgi:uncharacterized membrane protein YraQ (UPF0718 family)